MNSDSDNEREKIARDSNVSNYGNPFALTDNAFGCILIIFSAMVGSVETTMYNATLDIGISSNALTFAAVIIGLAGTLVVDAYYYYYGYANGAHVCIYEYNI